MFPPPNLQLSILNPYPHHRRNLRLLLLPFLFVATANIVASNVSHAHGSQLALANSTPVVASTAAHEPNSALSIISSQFSPPISLVGHQEPAAFLEFLDQARQGQPQTSDPLADLFKRNVALFILVVLGGGLLLNLTPCVLPMIPINLAIIGAGVQAASRRRGFMLGGAYGLGITVAYGALGFLSVLTGTAFGVLQSSPWFNGAIAIVFILLALALFDVFAIDFTRFQSTGGSPRAGSYGAAFGIGAVSALLAGACVAPVLISTLMLAASLHQSGHSAGLLLPFLLGLGMALPWPFAGAGLSFLPKPGAWMNRVKQAFGIIVLLFAFHYGRLAWIGVSTRLAQTKTTPVAAATQEKAASSGTAADGIVWQESLDAALAESLRTGQPLLADLWATWCTACRRMDRTTLQDPAVVEAVNSSFVAVKIQCENPADPETAALMKAFGAKGLPTFTVLLPTP